MEHSNLSSSSTHHHHQSGLHWSTTGYSPPPAPPSAWQNVAATTSLSRGQVKRPLSESDDCDDAYSEGSSKDHCSSPGNADSCQMLSRKKRRGVIEKKRRDRINMSLSELKRLVPSAFEKQGSAKLEKAEILQMTVDHLKMIHAKGLDSLAYDPHKYAMDYHGMGFRECVAEVARYLERIEGLDVQNPLRLRLTSHLQCCAAQRELASKQATTTTWSYPAAPQHYPPPPPPPTLPPSGDLTQQYDPPQNSQDRLPTVTSSSSSILTPLSSSALAHPYGHQYHHPPPPPPPPSVNGFHHHHQSYGQGSNLPPTSQGMKPYRPWGAELAY